MIYSTECSELIKFLLRKTVNSLIIKMDSHMAWYMVSLCSEENTETISINFYHCNIPVLVF